jgi:histidyl-tRNA synthetase
MPPKPLPGFRDFYPEQFAERAHIVETWRRIVRRYAFQEYDGPPLEPLELYTQKSGDEIVGQLYHFEDKGGRPVALRPEMTPTLARLVGVRAQALRKPVRWFAVPQLFRYERTQKGRLREHFQLNVDIIGEADVLADAELLAVAVDLMGAFGLTVRDVRARVSDRRLLNGLLVHLGVAEGARAAVYAVLDKLERQPVERSRELLEAAGVRGALAETVLGFGALTFEALQERYGEAPAVAEHAARFARYLAHAEALGTREWIRFDLTIVRGLAYYTGIVFELFDNVGEFRAICGGGRYDTLLASLGGADLPALGFGMGDVVLRELLVERGLMPSVAPRLDCWVLQSPADPDFPAAMLSAATALRRGGASTEYALRAAPLPRQEEQGRKAGAAAFVLVGPASADGVPTAVRRYSVRRPGRDDLFFDHLDALAAWASTPSKPAP